MPVVQESVCPTVAVPDATGATVFAGNHITAPSELELADEDPAVLVPVTVQEINAAASAATSRYVLEVALLILDPSRFHW